MPKIKVLVVDDDPNIVEEFKEILEDHDFKVVTTFDGEQALSLIHKGFEAISFVLSDFVMPKMDGMQLYKESQQYKIPFAIISGFAAKLQQDGAAQEQGLYIIPKPVKAQILVKTITEAIEKAEESA